jgi:hypothetical protein
MLFQLFFNHKLQFKNYIFFPSPLSLPILCVRKKEKENPIALEIVSI